MIQVVGPGVVMADGVSFQAFPGYDGPLVVAQTASLNIVSAGPGGGPRRLVTRRFTNPVDRLTDTWVPGVDPNTFRGGVTCDVPPEVPLTLGSGYPVFCSVEFPYGGSWGGDVLKRMADLLTGCNVKLLTGRPNDVPCSYGTVVISTTIFGVAGSRFLTTSGGASTNAMGLPFTDADYNTHRLVWVSAWPDPLQTAGEAVHELGHAFGIVNHDTIPGSVMNVSGVTPSSVVPPYMKAQILSRTGGYT